MTQQGRLYGKNAVVIGGTGTLGSAIALGLAREKASVTIVGRTLDKTVAKAKSLATEDLDISGLACDATDESSVDALFTALQKHGKSQVHALINCSGGNRKEGTVMPDQTIRDISLPDFRGIIEANFTSKFIMTAKLLPLLETAKTASIVNIGSMSGMRPLSRVISYSAAMAAVHSITESLAIEFATKKDTKYNGAMIRVNAILPGFFLADQNRAMLMNPDGTKTARGERIIQQTPMGTFGDPQALVPLAIYLASDESSFVTGQLFPVDGGFSKYSI